MDGGFIANNKIAPTVANAHSIIRTAGFVVLMRFAGLREQVQKAILG
jgi:hypothetical protein